MRSTRTPKNTAVQIIAAQLARECREDSRSPRESESASLALSMTARRIVCGVVATSLTIGALFAIPLYEPLHSFALFWVCTLTFTFCATEAASSLYATVVGMRAPPSESESVAIVPSKALTVKSVVVVPTLLIDLPAVERLIEALRLHFLSNREGRIYFGLLTDFPDANAETTSLDQIILEAVIRGIRELNDNYRSSAGERFFLLHRPRLWAQAQGKWTGYERKRGIILQFNEFLSTANLHAFSHHAGPIMELLGANYVITLDDDNELPDGGALKLVEHMLKPENKPVIDAGHNIVSAGHGVLQPAIQRAVRHGASRYQRLQLAPTNEGCNLGLIYHRFHGEGLFVGKGIYCVKTFQAVLSKRFPQDILLSHDILEGFYLRCGFVTDVHVTEEVPRAVPLSLARLLRWMRGDLQAAAWSLRRAPQLENPQTYNPLSALSRWKLIDRVRCNHVPCAMLICLVSGFLLSGFEGYMLTSVVLLQSLPFAARIVVPLFIRHSSQNSTGAYLGCVTTPAHGISCIPHDVLRGALFFATLPSLAWTCCTATFLSLWRLHVTRRRLLDWTTSAQVERRVGDQLVSHLLAYRANLVIAGAYVTLLLSGNTHPSVCDQVLVILWVIAPIWSWWLAQPAGIESEARVTTGLTIEGSRIQPLHANRRD